MEKTEAGTSVGVEDPYAHVDRCDHLTDEGRCRFAVKHSLTSPGSQARRDAVEHGDRDTEFADARSADEFRCPVVADGSRETPRVAGEDDPETGDGSALPGPWEWADCPHFRSRQHDRECARCGLAEVRLAHDDDRPLLEEHHLSYAGDATDAEGAPGHEVTVYLCRWCHAKVHDSWARIDDDVAPDPEAVAERERRRSRERSELGFESAAERRDRDE